MHDVTTLLLKIDAGDETGIDRLFPLVYKELRRMAAIKLAGEFQDHSLQATALVHEAYVRLGGSENDQQWQSRGHFFSAAAEAMRRILIDHARKRKTAKRGGDRQRVELDPCVTADTCDADELLDLDAALSQLEEADAESAKLVKLRFFAGLSNEKAAASMGISPRKAQYMWAFARAWLRQKINGNLQID